MYIYESIPQKIVMNKVYRNNGAYGALLDEYEKVVLELKEVISNISVNELVAIVDDVTKDDDCRSIQTILTHVVQSGYTYAIAIRKHLGEELEYLEKNEKSSIKEYDVALDQMMDYTIQTLEEYPNINLEEKDNSKKLITRWGQMYNVEQLLEHAIVHILRHRRQIERFLIKMGT